MDALFVFSNTINTLIPALFGATILAFFGFLLRYVFAKEKTAESREYIKGATRALIALFLMANMWNLIGLVNWVTELSPIVMFMIVIFAFLIFGAWSLFAVGDAFVALFSWLFKWVVDASADAVKRAAAGTPIRKTLNKLRPTEYRLLILFFVVLFISLLLYW